MGLLKKYAAFVWLSFTTSTDKKGVQNVKLFTTVYTFLSLNIRFNPFSLGGFVGLWLDIIRTNTTLPYYGRHLIK